MVFFHENRPSRVAHLRCDDDDGSHTTYGWAIDNFKNFRDGAKERKIIDLVVKSTKFHILSQECHLFVYPRGNKFLKSIFNIYF